MRDSIGPMNRANHPALAVSAGDATAVALADRTPLRLGKDDQWRHDRAADIDGRIALLENELLRVRKRCRARELALASMAGAVNTLRRANRALNDENVLLRQQVAELNGRGSNRAMARGPGLPSSGSADG